MERAPQDLLMRDAGRSGGSPAGEAWRILSKGDTKCLAPRASSRQGSHPARETARLEPCTTSSERRITAPTDADVVSLIGMPPNPQP